MDWTICNVYMTLFVLLQSYALTIELEKMEDDVTEVNRPVVNSIDDLLNEIDVIGKEVKEIITAKDDSKEAFAKKIEEERISSQRNFKRMSKNLNQYQIDMFLTDSSNPKDFIKQVETLQNEADKGIDIPSELRRGTDVLKEGDLSEEQVKVLSKRTGCRIPIKSKTCSKQDCLTNPYRTFDGRCNNLKHSTWGATNTPYARLAPPDYDNNFNILRGSTKGFPSPRLISQRLITTKRFVPSATLTQFVMAFGQFLDHDLDLAAPYTTDRSNLPQAQLDIPIPKNDPRFKTKQTMEFPRSSPSCGRGLTSFFLKQSPARPREQVNSITGFFDASMVYGNNEEEARSLRELKGADKDKGFLRKGRRLTNGKYLLPYTSKSGDVVHIECPKVDIIGLGRVPCFLAGDARLNEQPGLTTMHTIWFRQHNMLATKLGYMNPSWDGERIYQEARKIVGAQIQFISYNSFLPLIIGNSGCQDYLGEYKGYDPNIDPSIINSFATAAYRFGHTLINPILARLGPDLKPIPQGNILLGDAYFRPFRIVEEGGIDPILRGLMAKPSQGLTSTLSNQLTERLFENTSSSCPTKAPDLAALNIQRGRDHGLPSYNKFREICGLKRATSFDDFAKEITNPNLLKGIAFIYNNVDEVDLFVGGILEEPTNGARVGPVFQCIIGKQFKNLRDGDRFFFENPGLFTAEQLLEIKKTTLARIICDNSDNIDKVQSNVFTVLQENERYKSCNEVDELNLNHWTDAVSTPVCENTPIRKCQEENTRYNGRWLGYTYTSSWKDCSKWCRRQYGCSAWTFAASHNGLCMSKNPSLGKSAYRNAISGTRDCGA